MPKGQVDHNERVARPAHHCGAEVDHLVNADLVGGPVAVDDVRGRVSYQQALDVDLGERAGGGVVVGGEHRLLLTGRLLLRKVGDPDLFRGSKITSHPWESN